MLSDPGFSYARETEQTPLRTRTRLDAKRWVDYEPLPIRGVRYDWWPHRGHKHGVS